jgi:D-serine deaminase-like pyridoxal phosphate-dependent protein
VQALAHEPIPFASKGFGGVGQEGTNAAALVAAGAGIFDGTFTFPLLTVRASAVAHNVDQLARFCAERGLRLAPHAKTTMAPQLFAAQLDAGAWGLTVATVTQAQVLRTFGVHRILVANEVVDPVAIAWVAQELAADLDLEILCYVDSVDAVELLDHAFAGSPVRPRRRLDVLVELGFAGGRTGCRDLAAARAVVAAVGSSQALRVRGVAGFEGGLAHERSPQALAAVDAFCRRLVELGRELATELGPEVVISAGGSAFPDVVADAFAEATGWATVVLRSGCYLTHDDGEYARISPFTEDARSPYALTAALELWAPVLSRPEPDLALLGVGRRDVGFDQGMPVPRARRGPDGWTSPLDGATVTQLNDQHAFVRLEPGTDLAVADLVRLGVSHPCTTIDRWRYLVEVDDDHVVTDVVPTYF